MKSQAPDFRGFFLPGRKRPCNPFPPHTGAGMAGSTAPPTGTFPFHRCATNFCPEFKKEFKFTSSVDMMNQDSALHNEAYLFQLIDGGDETAFRQLFDLYRLRLFTFAFELTHSRADAEEIVQDLFLKLWRRRGTLSGVTFPKKYMYTMAHNLVVDHLTRLARDKKLRALVWANIQEEGEYTEQAVLAAETANIVGKAVTRLSARKQAIYYLSRREGLSHQEIAQRLGISVPTVKNTMAEVLRFIRTFMHTQYEPAVLLGITVFTAFY